jgi:hypothetical protein
MILPTARRKRLLQTDVARKRLASGYTAIVCCQMNAEQP